MKLKVIKTFEDKYTHETYQIGRIIDVSDDRGKEILAHTEKLVERQKEAKNKEK